MGMFFVRIFANGVGHFHEPESVFFSFIALFWSYSVLGFFVFIEPLRHTVKLLEYRREIILQQKASGRPLGTWHTYKM